MGRDRPILERQIEKYLSDLAPPRPALVREMEELASQRRFPIVGPLVGALLEVLSRALDARRVLELGSGFGYSAYWFARGMREGGKVVATESSGEDAERGRRYLSGLGLSEVVDYRVGEAILIASQLEGPFDIVFNDIDKRNYPRSLQVANRLLRPGGLFISDNMLWYGRVLRPRGDEATKGVKELTKALLTSKNYLTTLIPLRDGVTVSLKLC